MAAPTSVTTTVGPGVARDRGYASGVFTQGDPVESPLHIECGFYPSEVWVFNTTTETIYYWNPALPAGYAVEWISTGPVTDIEVANGITARNNWTVTDTDMYIALDGTVTTSAATAITDVISGFTLGSVADGVASDVFKWFAKA